MIRIKLCSAILIICVLFSFLPTVNAAEVVKPTSQFYVADYAEVFSDETSSYLIEKNVLLYDKTGAQVVIVTVDFLNGMDIEDYAYKLFNEWGIGSKEKNNGVLILLAIGEDNYWVLQGSGLESTLTSGTLKTMLNTYLEPDFAKKNYDAGAKKIFDAVTSKLSAFYGVTLVSGAASSDTTPSTSNNSNASGNSNSTVPNTTTAPNSTETVQSSTSIFSTLIQTFIFIVIVLLILSLIFGSKRRRTGNTPRVIPFFIPGVRRQTNRHQDPHYNPNSNPNDQSYDQHTSENKYDDDDPHFGGGGNSRGGGAGRSFFGGFGGGSNHSSGGGFGGGGGFSGGGGGSRGGGAGRG